MQMERETAPERQTQPERLRPQPKSQPQREKAQSTTSSSGKGPKAVVAALVLALAAGVGVWKFWPGASSDADLSETARQEIQAEFDQALPLKMPVATNPDEIDSGIRSLNLAPAEEQKLRDDIGQGAVELVWFEVWDHMEPDGDVITFSAGAYQATVPIEAAPQVFVLPVATAAPQITVQATKDGAGFGGVTAAVRTSNGRLVLPVVPQGTTFSVPLL